METVVKFWFYHNRKSLEQVGNYQPLLLLLQLLLLLAVLVILTTRPAQYSVQTCEGSQRQFAWSARNLRECVHETITQLLCLQFGSCCATCTVPFPFFFGGILMAPWTTHCPLCACSVIVLFALFCSISLQSFATVVCTFLFRCFYIIFSSGNSAVWHKNGPVCVSTRIRAELTRMVWILHGDAPAQSGSYFRTRFPPEKNWVVYRDLYIVIWPVTHFTSFTEMCPRKF